MSHKDIYETCLQEGCKSEDVFCPAAAIYRVCDEKTQLSTGFFVTLTFQLGRKILYTLSG